MPLVHHIIKFRSTKLVILYPSKLSIFDSFAVIVLTEPCEQVIDI